MQTKIRYIFIVPPKHYVAAQEKSANTQILFCHLDNNSLRLILIILRKQVNFQVTTSIFEQVNRVVSSGSTVLYGHILFQNNFSV